MGVSFKISKTGRRLRPKPRPQPREEDPTEDSGDKIVAFKTANISAIISSILCKQQICPDYEVSITLNLLPDGFFIGKPSETVNMQKLLQDDQRLLHPYNRAAETLFSAIELGCLPGDILDDMPSKYYNGAIVCEVCDFRNVREGFGKGVPTVKKVLLRMTLENIVKDVPSISDDSWTYGDLMELESRVLKILRPKLCLDPKPMLDRLCPEPALDKLNLDVCGFKRSRPCIGVAVASNIQAHGKKVCLDRARESVSLESADLGNISGQANLPLSIENTNMQPVASAMQRPKNTTESSLPGLPITAQSQSTEHLRVQDNLRIGAAGASELGSQVALQTMISMYADNAVNVKRDAQEAQLPNAGGTKRSKHAPVGQEGNQKLPGLHIDSTHGAEMWRNAMLQRQLEAKGIPYSSGISAHRPPMVSDIPNVEIGGSFLPNQLVKRNSIKQEQTDSGQKMDRPDTDQLKNTLQVAEVGSNQAIPQQLRPHSIAQPLSVRSQFLQQQWNNPVTAADKEIRKDDMLQKRKAAQSPRPGALVQSPASSKSGEFSVASVFASQKEKAAAISSTVVGPPSAASSPSDSFQRIPHAPTGKGKKGSIPKAAHTVGGVASPASVSNVSAPLSANSPSIVATSMAMTDSAVLERFSKIEIINKRFRLNNKKIRAENINAAKPGNYSSQEISYCLLQSLNAEDFTDSSRIMSGSIYCGSVNTCKSRVVKSVRSHVYQGNAMILPSISENRLLMTERPSDGTVAMLYDDSTEESDISPSEDCRFLLPNVHYADLLADQYVALMRRDGYQILDDQVQPIMKRFMQACGNPFLSMAMPSDNATSEGQQSESISGQQSSIAPNSGINQQVASQSISSNARIMPPGNNHALQMPQGYLPSGQNLPMPRAQQLEQGLQQQQGPQHQQMQSQIQQLQNPSSQIQQQQPQGQQQQQRPTSMMQMNSLSQFIGQNPNMQIGGTQMVNKASQIQLQALHQAQQQQYPRKPVMGMGAAAMGLGNNMMGLGGLGNVMALGGARGISSQVAPMPGLTNMGPNQMNLGSAANFNVSFRPGSIPATQAAILAASKMRMVQNRANLFSAQSGMTGLPGNTGQVLPNTTMSMLNQALNRPNVNPLQRTVMSTMGPPKISGANMYMTPQQLQLQQQLQQQHQLQQMQQQQQEQQQQMSSPLQQPQVSSPSIVGSPAISMQQQQQQISTQPISQQTVSPQQLSAGALQQMNNNGIAGPGPASPQLSSQTHGSIGSISSSPLEQLQGANKGSSMNTGQ